jgi:hypothetical protein
MNRRLLIALWAGILIIVAITYPGASCPFETNLEDLYLTGYLAVNDEAATFQVIEVRGPGTWPFSHSLEAKVQEKPISWGDPFTVVDSDNWPPVHKIVPIEAAIEIPLGDIDEPCKLCGHIAPIQVTFPKSVPSEYGRFYDESGEAKSRELAVCVLPTSMRQMLNAAQRMIERLPFNRFLFPAIFIGLNFFSFVLFISSPTRRAKTIKPTDSKHDQRQLSLPSDDSQN